MTITILYFASLGEALGCQEESYRLPSSQDLTVEELVHQLSLRNDTWQQLKHPSIRCAVNHDLVAPSTPLKTGDEVAFFPPVTGG